MSANSPSTNADVTQLVHNIHEQIRRRSEQSNDPCLQSEMAAIFLNHDIRRYFRCAEQAVLTLIDWIVFADSVRKKRFVVVPARREFLQANSVRAISVNLIGAHVNEHGIRCVTASSLEQVQCGSGVDVEIVERPGSSQVVAGLSCRVNNQRRLNASKQRLHAQTVADVEFMMFEILMLGLQAKLIPSRVAPRPEKICAQVVVDTMNFPTVFREVVDNL